MSLFLLTYNTSHDSESWVTINISSPNKHFNVLKKQSIPHCGIHTFSKFLLCCLVIQWLCSSSLLQIYSHTLQIPQYQTRQAMYVQCKCRALSCNYCSRWKAISITYTECVSIVLVIQDEKRMTLLHYHLWPLWLYHIFPCYLINGTSFGKKLLNVKCVLWFSQQLILKNFSF